MTTRNALWINNRRYIPPASEFIEIKMKADSNGKVYIPAAWCNWLIYTGRTFGNDHYDAPYDWDVLVDNVFSKRVTWISGRERYEEVGSWLEAGTFHLIKIYPHNYDEQTWLPDYWWCMAFGMGGKCMGSEDLIYKNPIADYLYEIIYDWAILGYRNSDHKLGSWYKTCQYAWCINLTKAWEETDVSDITEIGSHFLSAQYAHSWVTESATESTPDCPEALTWFREQQYWRCLSLHTASDEKDPPVRSQQKLLRPYTGLWYARAWRPAGTWIPPQQQGGHIEDGHLWRGECCNHRQQLLRSNIRQVHIVQRKLRHRTTTHCSEDREWRRSGLASSVAPKLGCSTRTALP